MATQNIKRFVVTVEGGNFNIEIEGTVSQKAYIAIHDKDTQLKYNNYLTYYYLSSFLQCDYIKGDGFPLMNVSGKNWINYKASSDMRIVIWDSTPDNHTIDAQYICRIPTYFPGSVEFNDFSKEPPVSENDHKQYLKNFRVSLNTMNWNINLAGNFSNKGWLAFYQDQPSPNEKNYTTYDWITSMKGDKPGFHRERGFTLFSMANGFYWFNYKANLDCYFIIYDIHFDEDESKRPADWMTAKERYRYHIPAVIPIEVTKNYKAHI